MVNCKYCGIYLGHVLSYSGGPLFMTSEQSEKLIEYEINSFSNRCNCRKIVRGLEILNKIENLSDEDVMWFREILVDPIYSVLDRHVSEMIDKMASEDMEKTLKFYRDLSKEVNIIVSKKISSQDAFNKFPRRVSECAVVGPLLGVKNDITEKF